MGKPKTQRTDEQIDAMIQDVAENGGEYSFKTVKGKVKDIHHTTAEVVEGRQANGQG